MNRPNIEEPNLLLPWYVNGTLNPAERTAVDEHLDDCVDCREAVAELRRIAVVVESDQPTPLVPEPPVNGFMADLPERELRTSSPTAARRHVRLYAVAATLLVLIGSTYLVATQPPESNVFRTVTDAPEAASVSYVFSVEIEAGAVQQVQQALEGAIAGGDIMKSETAYRVVVSMPSATMTELDVYADSLRQIDGVRRVDVVGVQLPID